MTTLKTFSDVQQYKRVSRKEKTISNIGLKHILEIRYLAQALE